MTFFDLHCDTLLKCCLEGSPLRKNDGHVDIRRLAEAGALAQCFAVWIPTGEEARSYGVSEQPYEFFLRMHETYKRELRENSGTVEEALSARDIERNLSEGKISSLLTVEDGELLDGKIERLDTLHEKGVRVLGLTWNYENCLGYPQSTDPAIMEEGLKPFGIEVICRMNEIGMIVDVSHLSDGGFYDVAKHSKKPFVASHSNARELSPWPRNLTDHQIKVLADSGGVCGVNFFAGFLRDSFEGDLGVSFEKAQEIFSREKTQVEDIVGMIRYIKNVGGAEVVALGSDFDGIPGGLAFDGYGGMTALREALSREFSLREVDMFCYENALRVFRDVGGS